MEPERSAGLKLAPYAIQESGSKKTHTLPATQRIESERGAGRRASKPNRERRATSSLVPFAWPNTSHARQTGSDAYRAKRPKPPIRSIGDLRRKKSGSPG